MKAVVLIIILFSHMAFAAGSFSAPVFCKKILSSLKEKALGRPFVTDSDSNAFSAGLTEAQELVQATMAIRRAYEGKNRSDRNVHVEELIPLANRTIEFLEADFKSLPAWKRTKEKQKLLESFKAELKSRTAAKHITYHWLFVFTFRAAIFADQSYSVSGVWTVWNDLRKESTWHTYEGATQVLQNYSTAQFAFENFENKNILALPTFGNLGIYSINLLNAHGIGPLGFISGKLKIDDQLMYTFSFWAHDINHMYGLASLKPEYILYAQKFLDLARRLPPKKRMMAEFYFFYVSHERYIVLENPGIPDAEIKRILEMPSMLFYNSESPTFYGPILKEAGIDISDAAAIQNWLDLGLAEFMKIHSKVNSK